MFDYLISHALKNVWCTPDQDNQVIVKPARITPRFGVWNSWKLLWTTLTMPEPTSRFHLYQIGQVHPLFLNLFLRQGEWVDFAEASTAGTTICDIYVTSGVQLPRCQTWYYVTKEKTLLIAVKRNDKIDFDFNDDDIFLRVYDNAYFQSVRSSPLNDFVKVEGALCTTTAQILALQAKYNDKVGRPGGVYCFVNGIKRSAINLVTVKVGDVAEYVYDSSIIRAIDFKVSDLPSFDSILDSKSKFLLHYAGSDDQTIDFYDDIDLFMVDITTQRGVYVHKNAKDTVRMLSHRDYAIPAAYVQAYFPHFVDPATGAPNVENLYLRVHVRKSGWLRPLVYEHHRIHELYKMTDADIQQAFMGIDSTVSVWEAAALELSKYPAIMSAKANDITQSLVKDAYGYHAISKLVGDTPQRFDASRTVTLPYLLRFDATVYEYDQDGLLIDWYRHTSGPTYVARNANAVYAEALVGEGTLAIEDSYDVRQVSLDPSASYRYYAQDYVNGVPGRIWRDVSGTGAVSVTPLEAVWLPNPAIVSLTRSDRKHLVDRQVLEVEQGILSFKLRQMQTRDGVVDEHLLEVPLGELDVFLNGHALIENLDFFMEFPHINIVNKDYLVNAGVGPQDVVARSTGFCTSELESQMANEFGYIQQGRISVNQRFDIHEGKVMRIVCGGRLLMTDELEFSEETQSYDFIDQDNGKPYLIRDLVVPMKNLVDENTYEFREKSLEVDAEISDYLSVKIPQDQTPEVNPLPVQRYRLFSPFFSRLIWLCQTDGIADPALWEQYGDQLVREICGPHEYLLAFDPISVDNQLNPDYVVVHPHYHYTEIELDLARYRFLQKAVRLYGNDLISLASFVKLV